MTVLIPVGSKGLLLMTVFIPVRLKGVLLMTVLTPGGSKFEAHRK